MRRTAIVLLAATLVVCAGTSNAGAAPRSVPPNVNVSRFPDNQAETAVAVNPTNPDNIVITSNVESFLGLFEAVSFDGGATWATRMIANGDNLGLACCDSSLAFDEMGNLFLTYLVYAGFNIPIALSTDGGFTFDVIDSILPDVVNGDGPSSGRARVSAPDQPTITTGLGSVWVTYTGGLTAQAAGAPVFGLGDVGRFGHPEVAVGANRGHFGDVAVGPGGLLIVYQDQSGEGPGDIYTDLDPDGLGPKGFDPARLVTTTNVGDFDHIPAAVTVTIDSETGLAWDRSGGPHNGRVYLLWTQEQPNESDDTDVLVQYSDDSGSSWSRPTRVNDDTGQTSQFMPKIALDQTTGTVAVSWYDCRNDLGSGRPGDTNGIANDDAMIYAAVSSDGGSTFRPNLRVAAGVSNSFQAHWELDFGDYEGLAFESGSFYPVWADNSDSTRDNPDGRLHQMDVYTARVRVP